MKFFTDFLKLSLALVLMLMLSLPVRGQSLGPIAFANDQTVASARTEWQGLISGFQLQTNLFNHMDAALNALIARNTELQKQLSDANARADDLQKKLDSSVKPGN
jgi:peptidoglycan hydrolase CwlO-like protein